MRYAVTIATLALTLITGSCAPESSADLRPIALVARPGARGFLPDGTFALVQGGMAYDLAADGNTWTPRTDLMDPCFVGTDGAGHAFARSGQQQYVDYVNGTFTPIGPVGSFPDDC